MFHLPARKLFVKDLQKCSRSSGRDWNLDLTHESVPNIVKSISVAYVWIQGYVEQVVGKENEILILNDNTGKVKITRCNTVPGGSSWVAKGMYCSVLGVLVRVSALPEVGAIKITDLCKNEVFPSLWPLEVEELKLLTLEQARPKLA